MDNKTDYRQFCRLMRVIANSRSDASKRVELASELMDRYSGPFAALDAVGRGAFIDTLNKWSGSLKNSPLTQ